MPGLEPFLPSLTLEPWLCHGCGFWQRLADQPTHCPVCLDSRHVQPPDGWRFQRAGEVQAQVRNLVDEPEPGVLRVRTEPGIGIGPMGYVVDGVAFEGTTLYASGEDRVGPLRAISASHPHSYGALWQLQDRNPDAALALPAADFAWSSAFRVTHPYDDRLDLGGDLALHVTGGHFPGHAVLHDATRGILFCGDALKFELDPADERVATAVSAHKAFVRGVPLTRNEVLGYRRVFEALDFEQTWTPFEQARNVGRREVLRFLDGLLTGRPHPDFEAL